MKGKENGRAEKVQPPSDSPFPVLIENIRMRIQRIQAMREKEEKLIPRREEQPLVTDNCQTPGPMKILRFLPPFAP